MAAVASPCELCDRTGGFAPLSRGRCFVIASAALYLCAVCGARPSSGVAVDLSHGFVRAFVHTRGAARGAAVAAVQTVQCTTANGNLCFPCMLWCAQRAARCCRGGGCCAPAAVARGAAGAADGGICRGGAPARLRSGCAPRWSLNRPCSRPFSVLLCPAFAWHAVVVVPAVGAASCDSGAAECLALG